MRAADAGDRRRAVLRLTPRGRGINRISTATVESAVEEALAGVSARDRAASPTSAGMPDRTPGSGQFVGAVRPKHQLDGLNSN